MKKVFEVTFSTGAIKQFDTKNEACFAAKDYIKTLPMSESEIDAALLALASGMVAGDEFEVDPFVKVTTMVFD